jgi:hypothetical protein
MKTSLYNAKKRGYQATSAVAIIWLCWMSFVVLMPRMTVAADGYESYFLFNGAYPDSEEPFYSDNVQGLTHDDNNWFISQTGDLWKIPVEYDLNSDEVPTGVTHVSTSDIHIAQLGYVHFGAPDYYKGYVLVPVGQDDTAPDGFLLFGGENLQYVGRALLPAGYPDGGWVAIDPAGYIHTSSDNVTSIQQYSLDWKVLSGLPVGFTLTLELVNQIPLVDENGTPLRLEIMQGGVFSPNEHLLYMVTGYMYAHTSNEGITVFNTLTWPWQRIIQSTNGFGHFNYRFQPGTVEGLDEPEGLTIWDLDDGRAPGIRGQLHVLMLDNDVYEQDDVTLYHYTNVIYVDGSYTGDETGEPDKPFNTVGKANNLAWDGARIKIKAGSYSEALTFSKRIQILPWDGIVTIGKTGGISLTPSGAINIYSGRVTSKGLIP